MPSRSEWTCDCGYHNGIGMTGAPLSCAICGRSRYAPITPDTPGFSGNASITINIPSTTPLPERPDANQ